MSELKPLPTWAKRTGPKCIEVEAGEFYPAILEELGVDDVDQYWLEVARGVMRLDLKVATSGEEQKTFAGGALKIIINDQTKATNDGVSRWAAWTYSEGKGEKAGAKDVRGIYKKLRGVMPAW